MPPTPRCDGQSNRVSRSVALLAVAAALALSPQTAFAQTGAIIRGTVIEAQSRVGIEGAQVTVTGTAVGTITNASGEFVLLRVPAGRVVVRAVRLGYSPLDRTITVVAGQTDSLNFTLSRAVVNLAEVVVTGTGGAVEKRTLGNSLTSVNASEISKVAPIATFQEMLQGRAAGVNMVPAGGTIGSGGNIRIRGLTSVSQNGDPLIYIDGVRIDLSINGPNTGGITPSRLTDLVPTDIERIEVVKGAAATTLYGTQAANGVIQIFTKRGATGVPRWSFELSQGYERLDEGRMPGRLWTEFQGPTGYKAHDPREIIENGRLQNYFGSVAGGVEALNYYFSGGYSRDESSIAPENNWLRKVSGRANVNTVLSPKMSLAVNLSMVGSLLRIPDNDNALHGLYSQVVSGVPWTADSTRRWGERWGSWDINRTIDNRQDVQRMVGGVQLDVRPTERWKNKFALGLDWIDEENTRYVPYGFKGSGIPLGSRSNQHRRLNDATVDFQSIVSSKLFGRVTSELSGGVQADFKNDIRGLADGRDFPAPGVTTVSSTAVRTAAETRTEEINGGVFVQEQLGFRDKLFVTAGLRVDGNSAFGSDFPLAPYPKASVAYNISQEGFWPTHLIPTMKLRVAFGTAGRSPAQFSADQTYIAISAESGQPAVTPGNVGDPNLGPEKSQELELGFDAGFWNDRVGAEVTYYNQRTLDALVQKQFPPSLGFVNRQFTNIGEVRNHGLEMGIHGLLINRRDFEWNANLQLESQHNEVTDLGGSPPISAGNAVRIVEGYPVLGIWTRGMKSWDPVKRTHIATDTLIYRGSAAPEWRGSLQTSIRFLRNWTVSAMGDFVTGMYEQNWAKGWSISKLTGDDYLALTTRPRGTPTPAADSLLNMVSVLGPGFFVEQADFIKFREVSFSYQLPNTRYRFLGHDGSLRLALRNLWTHAPHYGNPDPEVNTTGNNNFSRGSDFNTQPPARRFVLTFRTSY
jgi:TonB-dependent starch-binding outer membrane protein SusC